MKLAVYPGSFDPFTLGHKDILLRSSKIFDKVIVAIGENHGKQSLFSIEERISDINNEIKDIGIEDNVSVESFNGLIVDFARNKNANILIKGVRGPVDYDYELQMAGMNSTMNPDIETIFLISRPEYSYISSSLVKQIAFMKGDYSNFVSPIMQKSIKSKI
ncbi:MAG: pantetheine-phosphate adenylyltransferase [Pseudomonadota bacterium]|nr:pantetheine-phosphate adenylyltransferase [Pseudomonadota bacterium]MEC9414937.1 pantetheine-phosphate adenylyltransferase [Pseudomonadota bacterium]